MKTGIGILLGLFVIFNTLTAQATCLREDYFECRDLPLTLKVGRTSCSPPGGPVHVMPFAEFTHPDATTETLSTSDRPPVRMDGNTLVLTMILNERGEEVGYVNFNHSPTEGTILEIKYPARPDLETDGEVLLPVGQCELKSIAFR